jgi:hypothetical protein
MPPRVSGSRVTSVGVGPGEKPRPVEPKRPVAASLARRQKTSTETAEARLQRMRARQ